MTDGQHGPERRRALLDYTAECLARPGDDLLVVPDASDPQFVLPAGDRRQMVSSLLGYRRLRDPRTQLRRLAVAGAAAAGVVGEALAVPVEHVGDPPRLVSVLAARLGVPDLTFAIGLARYGPYAKPVLQLFDGRGSPVGYAKVGWTSMSAELVRQEAEALSAIAASEARGDASGFGAPQVMASFEWRDTPVLVTSPLPAEARRPSGGAVALDAPLREIAEIDGPVSFRLVAGLPCVTAVGSAADGALADGVAEVLERFGSVEVPVGRAHGDLVSWNAAWAGERLWLFDWEYSVADLPLGFDLVHGLFQEAYETGGRPFPAAVREASDRVVPLLARSGLDDDQVEAVVQVHRLEVARRAIVARAHGIAADQDRLVRPFVGLIRERTGG